VIDGDLDPLDPDNAGEKLLEYWLTSDEMILRAQANVCISDVRGDREWFLRIASRIFFRLSS
jgi:hypothetical protein